MDSVVGRLRLGPALAVVVLVIAGLAVASAAPARATGSGSALAQTEAVARGDWTQFGFLASGGRYNPFERVLSPANVAALGVDWSYHTGNIAFSSPAVVNGVVYVGSADFIAAPVGKVSAVEARAGKVLWLVATAADPGDSWAVVP